LPYKSDGLGYVLDRQIHLFLVDASTGSARQITKGSFDVRAVAWSPDGQRLAFARTRDERCAHRTDIWSIDVDGEDATQMSSHVASASFPKWSPDGRCVVFSGAGNEGDAQIRMWMIDSQEGTVRTVGDDDIDVVDGGSLTWDEDSRGISFIAGRRGLQEIGHVDLSDGRYSTIATGLRHVSALGVTANRRLAFVAESPAKPNQLYVCDSDGGSERCISSLNAWWDDRTSASVTLRGFDVPDGDGNTERVEGWVIRASANGPAGPLLVDIHGGPASHALLAFTSHPYWNVLVSHGWTILALNAVGSSGYGRSFSGRLRGRWGDIDLQQHLAAAEQLRQAGDVDGRMAVIGKSYGGYESAWAVTHGTQFRAAVIAAPITNLETHFGVSDSGYYSDPFDMGGTPLDVHDNYALLSPARYAGKVRTPVLIINGKEDNRCPMAQAEDFFVKVMRFTSTPAELVLYPGADHHFYESGKPSQRADVMSRIVSWLQAWIGTPVGVDN
jgi:dipeptidyl aminopeptidase/acylaminoacyl peptidase